MGHTVPLFPIRESSDPSNTIEPSFDPVNQRVESENQPNEVSNVPSQNKSHNSAAPTHDPTWSTY